MDCYGKRIDVRTRDLLGAAAQQQARRLPEYDERNGGSDTHGTQGSDTDAILNQTCSELTVASICEPILTNLIHRQSVPSVKGVMLYCIKSLDF